jgi:acyl-coenzyme A synthetase/AMP-(fatty) acid ligase
LATDTSNPLPAAIDPGALEIPFRTLSAAFADFAHRHPDKTAIHSIDQNKSVNFKTLQDVVDRTAAKMMATGVGRGDRVAILCGECVEKLVLMFAVWRCGASACPFHAEIAADHLQSILESLKPALVLWRTGDLDGIALTATLEVPVFAFDRLDENTGFFAGPRARTQNLPAAGTEYGPEDEGCIFATSGTTDRPKCVVWDHLGLWLCGLSTIDFTGMTGDDRLLEYRTFSWLSPQIVTFMPFISLGLTIVMAEGFSRSRFVGWIRDHRITVAAGVPTVINMLLEDPVPFMPEDIASLRIMTASSAPLAPERWRQFEEHYGIRLLQFYGASEGGWLCGKITIRGPQTATASITADGEWEDRTCFRLTERTRVGDLGILDEDGFVTVTGRIKDVILRGGVSIAPLEIDAAVMTHPLVHEAAVIGVADPIWGEEIAWYVVPAEGSDITELSVLEHAANCLPDFKRPRHVRIIDRLPKNDRGKVRREDLKSMWANDSG